MSIEVQRTDLVKAFQAVKPALKSNAGSGGGLVTYLSERKILAAHSDEIVIRYEIDLGGESFSVYSDKLLALLSRMDRERLTLDLSEGELIIKSRNLKSGIRLQEAEDPAVFDLPEDLEFEPIPESFIDGLKFTVISCAKDLVIPVLTCIFIQPDVMMSCDQYRGSYWRMDRKVNLGGMDRVLLPASSLREVLNYDINLMAFRDSWANFKTSEGTVLSCYTYSEEMIPLESLFDVGEDRTVMEWPPETLPSLKRAEVFSDSETKSAQVTVNKKLLKIRAQSDDGWYEEKVAAKVVEGNLVQTSFHISVQYLQDILVKNVPIIITDRRVLFNGPNWKHVIATVRADESRSSE